MQSATRLTRAAGSVVKSAAPATIPAVVFAALAGGYLLSYLLRNLNAVLAPALVGEFAIGPVGLGMLTSAYFLGFAAALLPVGAALDRFGPGRVQVALLTVAATGCLITAQAGGLAALVVGRLLIGIGVSACLMAGLKAIVLWFPREHTARLNGLFVALGALGAVLASAPAELALSLAGWRNLFLALAAAIVATLVAIARAVPAAALPAPATTAVGYDAVLADARFWRLAPIAGLTIGSAWALQGLWAAPWLRDVAGLGRADVLRALLVMGFALMAGSLALGTGIDRLRRRGVPAAAMLPALVGLLVAAELMLALGAPVPALVPWCIIAIASAGTVVTYTASSDIFPKEIIGRANSALNVFHMLGAFSVQGGVGVLLSRWQVAGDAHLPRLAYTEALLVLMLAQGVALAWYVAGQRSARRAAA